MVIEINRRVGPRADSREREDWFLRLDEDARDVVRARWLEEDLGRERIELVQVRRLRVDVAYGAMLIAAAHFVLLMTLGLVLSAPNLLTVLLTETVIAAVVGAGLGAFWHWRDSGQLGCTLSAGATVLLFQGAFGMPMLFAALCAAGTAYGGQYIGLRRTEILR